MPGELELSKLYFCSRATIRKALSILEREGYVYKKRGQGTFVKVNKLDYNLNYLESFTEQMLKSNRKPCSELLMIEKTDDVTVDVKQTLKLNGNDKVYRVKRLRYADEELSKILDLKINSPVLLMNCSVYLENDEPLYHVLCYYIGERRAFTARKYR